MASKPTALHFSLIFFVMATLILGVLLYVTFDEGTKLRAEVDQKTKQAGDEKAQARQYLDSITDLKDRIGYSKIAKVGAADDTGIDSVIGSMNDDIKKLGGPEARGNSYAETLRAMKTKSDNLNSENIHLKQKTAELEDKFLKALTKHYTEIVSEHDKAQEKAEKERSTAVKDKDREIEVRDNENKKLQVTTNNLQGELKKSQDDHEDLKKKSDKEKTQLESINDYLTDAVRKRERITYDRPDGLVRFVDNDSGLVWINIGRADKLTTRTLFSVYRQTHRGVGRPSAPANTGDNNEATDNADDRFSPGLEEIKGSIEVTRVIGAHLSEARILKYDIYDPLQPDDLIYTPLWAPGRPAAFAFVGLIDFDKDGASNRRELHEMIAGIGGKIIHEVLDDGSRVFFTEFPGKSHEYAEEDPKIDLGIKYLVIGRIPDLSDSGTDEEKQAHRQIIAHHKAMISEARKTAVRRINLSDFLAHIGYVPQRRLYVPGLVDRPFNLKSGATSQSTGGTVGERSSSGKVSSLFTRSKRLKKQPVSSGTTSKRFQPGN